MRAFLLKLQAGDQFYTVAGLREERLIVQDRALSLLCKGIFLNQRTEMTVMGLSITGREEPMQLSFECGQRLRGNFRVVRFEHVGETLGEQQYRLELAGENVEVLS